MAKLSFSCPACHKTIHADASFAGKRAKCPSCAQRFTVPGPPAAEAGSESPPILPTSRVEPVPSQLSAPATKRCRFCGETVSIAARKCKHCREWLSPPDDRDGPDANGILVVSPALAVLFSILTCGLYQPFWLYRVFSELHARGATETTPGQAVGFCFIPVFNFVWIFMVWIRLAKAVAFEFANARRPIPWTNLTWLAPLGFLVGLIALAFPPLSFLQLGMVATSIACAQSWMNTLADIPRRKKTRPCPQCSEPLPPSAAKCRSCQRLFSAAEVQQREQDEIGHTRRVAFALQRHNLSSRKFLLQLSGWTVSVLAVLFLLLCVFAVIPRADRPNPEPAVVVTMFVMGLLPVVLGAMLLWFAAQTVQQLKRLSDPDETPLIGFQM